MSGSVLNSRDETMRRFFRLSCLVRHLFPSASVVLPLLAPHVVLPASLACFATATQAPPWSFFPSRQIACSEALFRLDLTDLDEETVCDRHGGYAVLLILIAELRRLDERRSQHVALHEQDARPTSRSV
jgi:hypothetical protein